jgi:NAD-dependent SIR2 family protein deacetylase
MRSASDTICLPEGSIFEGNVMEERHLHMQDGNCIEKAAAAIAAARSMIITAGAGMGIDSGLPDFRGPRGFWRAYPMYERLGIDFAGAANPRNFEGDPAFGWGFYGHRSSLYRVTTPHEGFAILLKWLDRFGLKSFVLTSNVDGQFQKAGFPEDRIVEVHGSIHHLQCIGPCSQLIWENVDEIPVDLSTMRACSIPLCLRCGGVARPNILMFGDRSWISTRSDRQHAKFHWFLDEECIEPVVVVEIGAGTAIPTIRKLSEGLGRELRANVIRINPGESDITMPHISISRGALETLKEIEAVFTNMEQ